MALVCETQTTYLSVCNYPKTWCGYKNVLKHLLSQIRAAEVCDIESFEHYLLEIQDYLKTQLANMKALKSILGSFWSRYSPSSPAETHRESSSETMSPIYPDRPIKPMPKRRLKDRLSSEAAETITYPPAPSSSGPVFYTSPHETAIKQFPKLTQNGVIADADQALIDAQTNENPAKDVPYEFHGTDSISDDENISAGRQDVYRSQAIRAQSRSIASSGDSADGYESFENTNNKKKRKIPMSTNGGLHPALPSSLSADLASMGISSTAENGLDGQDGGLAHYYGSGERVTGNGISGAGRGRYGRTSRRDTRSPVGASANASNAWQTGLRLVGHRHSSGKYANKSQDPSGDSGIISQAIADAAAQPLTTDKGQENISLLEQQQRAARKNNPATQFTFHMNSEATKGPSWPGDQYSVPPGHFNQQHRIPVHGKGYSQGTQTSPNMVGQGQSHNMNSAQQSALPPKPRRPPHIRYARAARERKINQEYENIRNPLGHEDVWICEFCEYELIFGHPPEALIRQYEIKDAHERKRQAEKRRLLEKAKSKGRKARKGTKTAKANAAAAAAVAANANVGGPPPQIGQSHGELDQTPYDPGEDFYSVEGGRYDDEPSMSTTNSITPAASTKIPAPTQHYGAAPRPKDRSSYGVGQVPDSGGAQQKVAA